MTRSEERYEQLEITGGFDVPMDGFIYIYVANETNKDQEVYFDDLKITHENATADFKVSQINDYYPYGMVASSYRALGYVDLGQLYMAGFSEYDSLTGFYDFQYRSYDPVLGQFFAIDPLASSMTSHSPYHANFNNPMMYGDPLGLAPAGGSYDYERGVPSEYLQNGGRWDRMDGSDPVWTFGVNFGASWGYRKNGRVGSGHHWSDGIMNSDWNPNTGSQIYKEALANGATAIGSGLYEIGKDGSPISLVEKNGKLGYWEDRPLTEYAIINGRLMVVGGGVEGIFHWVGDAQNGSLIDLRQNNSGQLIADFLAAFARKKRADISTPYPYLDDFIDPRWSFQSGSDTGIFTGWGSGTSGTRNIYGLSFNVKITKHDKEKGNAYNQIGNPFLTESQKNGNLYYLGTGFKQRATGGKLINFELSGTNLENLRYNQIQLFKFLSGRISKPVFRKL